MLEKCYNVGKVIAYSTKSNDALLCHFCGEFYTDSPKHFIITCSHTVVERESFWDIVTNEMGVSISAYLNNLEDDDIVPVILGSPCDVLEDLYEHTEFLRIAINFINKLLSKVDLFTEPK